MLKKESKIMEARWKRAAIGGIVLTICFIIAMSASRTYEPITSNWELVEYTVNGKTTKVIDEAEDNPNSPSFVCKGNNSCVVSVNGKDHEGYMTESAKGKYKITFDDTDQGMTATIKGHKLTLENDKKTVEIIFEAD